MGQANFFMGDQPGMPSLGSVGVGDLVALLDCALVNGSTPQAVTSITRSGTTATLTRTAHGRKSGQRITIEGANQSDYNVTARITVIDADTYTFEVANSPATPATGTITEKVAPLGFNIEYTASNQRVYRAPSGNRHYLQVIDSADTYTGRVRGYQTMSAINTGTGPFPTTSQSSTNLRWPRPDPSISTLPWVVWGDEKRFWVGIPTYSTDYRIWFFFGESAFSYKGGDVQDTILYGYVNTDGSDTISSCPTFGATRSNSSQGASAFYSAPCALARAQDQSTASYLCGILNYFGSSSPWQSEWISSAPSAGAGSTIAGLTELGFADVVEMIGSTNNRRCRFPILCTWTPPDFVNNDGVLHTGIANFPDGVVTFRGDYQSSAGGMTLPLGDLDTVFG